MKDTNSEAVLDAYVRRFGDSFYAEVARDRLAQLRRQKVAVVAPPPQRRLCRAPALRSRRSRTATTT